MSRSRLSFFFLLAGLLLAAPAFGQADRAAPDVVNRAAYDAPALLPPNDYRSGSGAPGPDYWQQAADYQIDVTLDPEQHRLSGTETITYTNNAPQALDFLWVQLDQNLFAPGSRGAAITPADQRFSGAFKEGGYDITGVRVRGQEAEHTIDDTRMRITLAEPLESGDALELSVDFAFTIPPYGADRMGRLDVEQGTVYEIAQWYPRMYVFDDVHGWNPLPYLGQGEYYLEYGNFDVSITVPRAFIVAATGELQNPEEVLTAEQRERLEAARQSGETVTIISRDEVGQPSTRPEGSGPLTWHYRAENVRDVSWAASQAFIWDAARAETGDGAPALAQSVYPQEGLGTDENPGWERSTQYTKHSIEFYSEMWEPYPYPVAINVAGIVGGMEYPQIVFCSVEARGEALFGVTDHEFGHEWFPMVVGSDERRYAWMDEGLNTFINFYSMLAFYGDHPSLARGTAEALTNAESAYAAHADRIARIMSSGRIEQAIGTPADRIIPSDLGFLAYRKPAQGLILLRDYVLGPERFDPAFREYIDRWAYKHPQPADFFRTIEDVAGEDLGWFWSGWFFSTDQLDQAITEVQTEGDTTRVTLENAGGLVMPVVMEVTLEDGQTEQVRVPVEAFFNEDRFTAVVPGTATRVRLDPEGYLPDVNMNDNTWSAEGSMGTGAGAGRR